MEKFSGLLSSTYQFTDKFDELPDFLLKRINKALAVDWTKETFVASCWIQNLIARGEIFILVTNQRVAYSDNVRVKQNLFADMTGVERNMMKNIALLSPGNSTTLFSSMAMPVNKLMDRMFDVINHTWIKTRQAPTAAAPPASAGIIEQIEQLNELKNKGILTEEEFQRKKTDLLAKI
jgi:hypothetical protein